jgi:ribosomal subunit interface protein
MDIHVTTRHCTLADEDHTLAIESAKQFEHYFDPILRVDVICDENAVKHAEFTVKIPGHVLVAKEQGNSFSKAIHDAAEKMKRQLSKHHDVKSTVRSSDRG